MSKLFLRNHFPYVRWRTASLLRFSLNSPKNCMHSLYWNTWAILVIFFLCICVSGPEGKSWASFPNGVAYPQLKSSQLLNGWNSQGDLKKKCSFSDPLNGTLWYLSIYYISCSLLYLLSSFNQLYFFSFLTFLKFEIFFFKVKKN